MIRSSIDLGTNTCLLLIADVEKESGRTVIRREIGDDSTIVRLGEGVDQTRMLKDTAISRTLDCLKGYAEKVRAAGADPRETFCVATSSSRDSKNGAEFFARVEKETDFRFRVISGDEEAKLTFLGALLPDLKAETSAVIDIGGGSTELIALNGGQSVDIGSVRFTERFLKSDPVKDDEFWACQMLSIESDAALILAQHPFARYRACRGCRDRDHSRSLAPSLIGLIRKRSTY